MCAAFEHPALGSLLPRTNGRVNQFLGLQYATLKDRFATPVLFSPTPSYNFDTTKHGPSVITPSMGCALEFGIIQQTLPVPDFEASEVDGLNLNITTPCNSDGSSKLAVLVFIHGGGFAIGGNSWPQYDAAQLVELAIEQKKPMIVITINYRVGVFGFLTSEEMRNAGYTGNNGLRDQQCAFEWIKKYIGGFGGDPDNITVGGESAGGACTTFHLYSEKPQFTRAISLGGTSLLIKPLAASVYETIYKTVLERLGITSPTPEERVAALLAVPVEDILKKLPFNLPLRPMLDGELITRASTFTDVRSSKNEPGWCKSILIGHNQLDASIFAGFFDHAEGRLVNRFITSVTKHLASYTGVVEALLETYHINVSLSDDEALFAILGFANDIGYFAPTLMFAEGFSGKAYVYCFDETNPWQGRFEGLSDAQAKSARNFAIDVISFVSGNAPWTVYEKDTAIARIYGPSKQGGEAILRESSFSSDVETVRDMKLFRFDQAPGLDVISAAFDKFLAGQ